MKVVALADLPGGLTAISLSFSEDQAVIWRADEDSDCQAILHIQGDYNVGTLSRDASRALLAYDRISYWRAEKPQELEHFAESLEAVQKIAFTASGLLAAAGDLYGNIVVWDLETLQARWLVPMHYGTFKLSFEDLDEPPRWLRQIVEKMGGQVGVENQSDGCLFWFTLPAAT